jgi:hypothetical protein
MEPPLLIPEEEGLSPSFAAPEEGVRIPETVGRLTGDGSGSSSDAGGVDCEGERMLKVLKL